MRKTVIVSIMLSSLAFGGRPAAAGSELWIRDAIVVDVRSGETKKGVDVVVVDGVIDAVQPAEDRSPGEGARILEAEGRFLMPGLFDAHHHLAYGTLDPETTDTRRRLLEELPSWGVTSIFDPNLELETWQTVSAALSEEAGRARVLRTGPSIGAVDGWASAGVADAAAARERVRDAVAEDVDAIKVVLDDMGWLGSRPMPMLAPDTLVAAIEEARKANLGVWVHAPQLEHARAAIDAGVTGLVHGIVSGPIDADLLAMLRERDVAYVSTHALYETYADFSLGVTRQSMLDPRADRDRYARLRSDEMVAEWQSWWDGTDRLASRLPILRANLRALHKAGVRVVAGTDAGTPGVFSGVSLLWELQLLVEAGLSPAEALRAATLAPAQALGLDGQQGEIRPGLRADLLLLRNNPLEDTRALLGLQYVVLGGEVWSVPMLGGGLRRTVD